MRQQQRILVSNVRGGEHQARSGGRSTKIEFARQESDLERTESQNAPA